MKNDISIKQTVMLFLRKFLLIFFSVWSYIPIIVGILLPMLIILPIAYASWIIPSLLPGGLLFDAYIPTSPEDSFEYIFLLSIEIIIFIGGIFLFSLGLYHLTREEAESINCDDGNISLYSTSPKSGY